MRITAAVLRSAADPFVIEELELSDPGPGEVLVELAGVGLCHTDMLPKLTGAFPLPTVLGHEGSGIVKSVGDGVSTLSVGDRVALSYASCGGCSMCTSGSPQYCDAFYPLNFFGGRLDFTSVLADTAGERVGSMWFGQSSFASHAVTYERNCVKVPDDVPLELMGPFGCGFQTGAGAVMLSLNAQPNTAIAVYGAGAVGLAAVMAAVAVGCSPIIAVDLHQSRLDLALELGATHVVNASTAADVSAAITEISPGGVHSAFDTTAVPGVIRGAVNTLRPGGVACLVGAGGGDISLDAGSFLFGRTVKGVIEGDATPQDFIPRLIELYKAGKFPIEKLITTYRLDQINEAIHDSETGATIKPVFIL